MKRITTQILTPRHINVNEKYPTWGLAGYSSSEEARNNGAFDMQQASPSEIQQGIDIFTSSNMLSSDFILTYAAIIPLYQGPEHPVLQNNLLLRYVRNNGENSQLGGEHISAVIDLDNQCIMSACRMLSECNDDDAVTPDIAFKKASAFLQQYASDLQINNIPELPLPQGFSKGEGVDVFTNDDKVGYTLGQLELLWIGGHNEKIVTGDCEQTHGMKVKFRFTDGSARYAWVIIDKASLPHVFERNIFWDFDNVKRGTQMWLNDVWLQAHHIDLEKYRMA